MSSQLPSPPPLWKTISLTAVNTISLISVITLVAYIKKHFSASYSNKMITHIAIILIFLQADQLVYTILIAKARTYNEILLKDILGLLQLQLFILCQSWTVPISIHGYKIIVQKMKFDQKGFYKNSMLFVYIVGLVPLVGGVIFDLIFPNQFTIELAVFLFTTYNLYLAASLIISIILYFKQKIYVKANFNSNLLGAFNIKIGKLTLYPIFSLIVFTPYFLEFVKFFIWTGAPSEIFRFIIDILYGLQGTLYLIFYVFIRNTTHIDLQYINVKQCLGENSIDNESFSQKIQESVSLDLSPTRMLKVALLEDN